MCVLVVLWLSKPYTFALPGSWPQVLPWMQLLARVHADELQL
jgi:hypothetical protein